nr:integrase, catalytic region, zinc finger, CCHC-type, peptidase aspartic, catalytic [Tanacetum cinerariifolium]
MNDAIDTINVVAIAIVLAENRQQQQQSSLSSSFLQRYWFSDSILWEIKVLPLYRPLYLMLGIKCTRHSHCQKKFPLPVKKVPTAEEKQCHCCEDCTATKVKKKLSVKVILFMRLAKGIADFGNGIITIHPELDPFLDNSKETKKFEDDCDHLLDIDFGNILEIDEAGLPPFVCKMGKSKRNKKRALENFWSYYYDFEPSFSNEKPLTQEEAAQEALAIDICKIFSILKEERPVNETMTYSDKYKKILDGIVMDKIKLDGEIKKEEEEAIKQWGNILITRVYFFEGLGHNLFSVGQLCDSDLEVAFRRDACFIRNLKGVDLLNGDRSTNLYTINLHEMASASPICLMDRASSTKSWLWHQRLSHLNFDTINDLARNDLVSGLSKFKYHKEHLCPSCEQGKSKRASHPPKPVLNSRQRLHLLHMDLCGPMRTANINEKRYVLVIVDDYSRYTWVHFLRSKDEAPAVIITFLKQITVLLQKLDISFLHVFGALCYPKNDRDDIGKLGAKGDIGFFNGYSADSCAYRIYNRRTKKIMETMNVSFDELSVMAFEQHSLKLGLQSMTSGQISSGLDLTYAPSIITTQQPTEGKLNLLFEAMYDDYIGGQPSATGRTVSPTQGPQVRRSSTASTIIADTAPIPTNSSSLVTNILITSQDVDEPNSNAMVDGNTFVNPFANSSTSAAASSSSQNMDPSNMHTFYQPYPHEFQWTKDHPLEQVIGEPSRPVLTRNQLRSDGDMCMYALTVSTIEPKNVKEAMADPAWIDSMQEELL